LVTPGNNEYQGEDPGGDRDGGHGEGAGGAGARDKPRSLTYISRTSTEVVSKANNIMGDVHGRATALVDEDTFKEPSEYLEGHEDEHKNDATGVGVDRS